LTVIQLQDLADQDMLDCLSLCCSCRTIFLSLLEYTKISYRNTYEDRSDIDGCGRVTLV
jgi:hypothetical protein